MTSRPGAPTRPASASARSRRASTASADPITKRRWHVRSRSLVASRGPPCSPRADPGLSMAALLADDISEARDWVADALGDLAGDDENDARLRETLRVFLRCGSSYKLAAEELTLHFNTVRYRVGRAIARRGRPIDDDRLDVEVALLLCQLVRDGGPATCAIAHRNCVVAQIGWVNVVGRTCRARLAVATFHASAAERPLIAWNHGHCRGNEQRGRYDDQEDRGDQ